MQTQKTEPQQKSNFQKNNKKYFSREKKMSTVYVYALEIIRQMVRDEVKNCKHWKNL